MLKKRPLARRQLTYYIPCKPCETRSQLPMHGVRQGQNVRICRACPEITIWGWIGTLHAGASGVTFVPFCAATSRAGLMAVTLVTVLSLFIGRHFSTILRSRRADRRLHDQLG